MKTSPFTYKKTETDIVLACWTTVHQCPKKHLDVVKLPHLVWLFLPLPFANSCTIVFIFTIDVEHTAAVITVDNSLDFWVKGEALGWFARLIWVETQLIVVTYEGKTASLYHMFNVFSSLLLVNCLFLSSWLLILWGKNLYLSLRITRLPNDMVQEEFTNLHIMTITNVIGTVKQITFTSQIHKHH